MVIRMADFLPAFEEVVLNEGGYKLTDIKQDRGGQTYAGISRKFHPHWPGWSYIDRDQAPPVSLVRAFYKDEFWDRLRCDEIEDESIAMSLFDFGVNAGWRVSAKLAQVVLGLTPDGVIGPKSIAEINRADPRWFKLAFSLAKLARYRDIVTRDRTQGRFLLGWINRLLKGVV